MAWNDALDELVQAVENAESTDDRSMSEDLGEYGRLI